ncbi:MAG: hypothetical protein K6A71_04470 [Lachnospiraceae bacterium]|nr:hypothetical protein [Lachnospiraceae bacterium]
MFKFRVLSKGIVSFIAAASVITMSGGVTVGATTTTAGAWPTPIPTPAPVAQPAAVQPAPATTAQSASAAQPTPAATDQPSVPAATQAPVTPNPIPASQAPSILSVTDIIALVGHPRLNTTPVASQAPVVTSVAATDTPVMVDLIIFAGQSNMSGNGGNAALAPAVPAGAGFEYRPTSSPNALYPLAEPFGRNERGFISDQPQFQNGTMVSAFVNTYFQKTGVPVVAVPATCGGTDSSFWASPAAKADLLSRYNKAKAYLEKNNFKVRKKFLVFMQGESDAVKGISAFDYKNNLTSAFQPLLAGGLDQVFLITPGYAVNGMFSYDDVVNAQTDLCNSNNMFTLASNVLHSQSMNVYLDDAVHYNQQGLNLAGSSAAGRVAAFAGGIK